MKDNQAGHIKESTEDDNGYRQFIINCLGDNDRRKYFSLSPFGYDFNVPENTRSLTTGSRNKDTKYNLGVLNKIKVDDLSAGECVIFSTDSTGETLKSKQVYRNTGDIEINKDMANGNILIKADGTIEFNGDADFLAGFNDLKSGFDTLKTDFNNLVTSYNAHIHITTATVGATPTPGIIAPTASAGTPSSASIDSSKKENLKTE